MDKIHETNMMTYRYREDWFIDIFSDGKFWQAWIYKEESEIPFKIIRGDITRAECDAIACVEHMNMQRSTRMVS